MITKKKRVLIGTLIAMVYLASSASAALTYIVSGIGSGSLGGQAFSDATFTITTSGEPADVTHPNPLLHRLEPLPASLEIFGVGAATFENPANLAVNQRIDTGGIADLTQDLAILFVDSPQMAYYDLTSSLDTVTGQPSFNAGREFPTSSGAFVLDEVTSASFQVIPEASTSLLLLSALTFLFSRRSRRR